MNRSEKISRRSVNKLLGIAGAGLAGGLASVASADSVSEATEIKLLDNETSCSLVNAINSAASPEEANALFVEAVSEKIYAGIAASIA